jgi:hypothetical protein
VLKILDFPIPCVIFLLDLLRGVFDPSFLSEVDRNFIVIVLLSLIMSLLPDVILRYEPYITRVSKFTSSNVYIGRIGCYLNVGRYGQYGVQRWGTSNPKMVEYAVSIGLSCIPRPFSSATRVLRSSR